MEMPEYTLFDSLRQVYDNTKETYIALAEPHKLMEDDFISFDTFVKCIQQTYAFNEE